jgi:hypothetical protein
MSNITQAEAELAQTISDVGTLGAFILLVFIVVRSCFLIRAIFAD